MRLFSYLADDGPAVGLLIDGQVVRLQGGLDSLDIVLTEERLDELTREAGRRAGEQGTPVSELTPLPALEFPGKIVLIGLNFRDHIVEQRIEVPSRPTLFAKFGNAIVGHGEPIVRPEGTHALDLEVELAVVIGRRASRVSRDRAMDHVAGYIVVNDVSARDWQGAKPALKPGERGDGQWLRAKGSDTFLPVGPVFVTTDEIPNPRDLHLRSWLIPGGGPRAGERILMQDGTTADMLYDIPELIEFVTASITLEPGDILSTGTPSGVGVYREPPVFLQPGDRVRCEVEGVGWVENPVIDWTEVAADGDGPDEAEDVDEAFPELRREGA
jgi:2-keto-4-pentenoate hydratase/2-oxohepta-3-ene-1,7-dioic acid hydratase in catechol pathway